MLIHLNPTNPDQRRIEEISKILSNNGVVILPTDTIYALVCNIYSQKAIDKICRIKGVKLEKSNLSFLCSDLANISTFTKSFDRNIYKLMNRSLPGPYTFILEAGHEVPSIFRSKKKTIGIRVPDNKVVQEVIKHLGNPVMSTSLHNGDEITSYPVDPMEIFEQYEFLVDAVVDGGNGHVIPSTIIDCTGGEPRVVREGAGVLDVLR